MGRMVKNVATVHASERALGELLFERYPHLVPSPTWMSSLSSLICGLEEGPLRASYANARPLRVLEAWFDCWAAVALRPPPSAWMDAEGADEMGAA